MGIFSKLPIFGDEAVAKGTRKAMMNSYNKIKNSNPGFGKSDKVSTKAVVRNGKLLSLTLYDNSGNILKYTEPIE